MLKNSIFGKIISIDLQSKDYEIISMGSRNAQGLYYDEAKNIIIHTEHGPTGGDEININFGRSRLFHLRMTPFRKFWGQIEGAFLITSP